jgi:hypothetical protein
VPRQLTSNFCNHQVKFSIFFTHFFIFFVFADTDAVIAGTSIAFFYKPNDPECIDIFPYVDDLCSSHPSVNFMKVLLLLSSYHIINLIKYFQFEKMCK